MREFARLVNEIHQENIGSISDIRWTPLIWSAKIVDGSRRRRESE
jgi:hypothetical protein